jgi:hypothetical protein
VWQTVPVCPSIVDLVPNLDHSPIPIGDPHTSRTEVSVAASRTYNVICSAYLDANDDDLVALLREFTSREQA